MAPVLGLAALLADTLPVGATEGYQWAVVGGAHPQVPVPGGLRQLVAVQPAVLLVRPQVLRAVVHHAGQAGLDGPHPAGPETGPLPWELPATQSPVPQFPLGGSLGSPGSLLLQDWPSQSLG